MYLIVDARHGSVSALPPGHRRGRNVCRVQLEDGEAGVDQVLRRTAHLRQRARSRLQRRRVRTEGASTDAVRRCALAINNHFRDSASANVCFCSAAGIGAQFGGKYFCHDVRVARLPRHGASCPIGIGVSCSADRQVRARACFSSFLASGLNSHCRLSERSQQTASSSSSSKPTPSSTCPRWTSPCSTETSSRCVLLTSRCVSVQQRCHVLESCLVSTPLRRVGVSLEVITPINAR